MEKLQVKPGLTKTTIIRKETKDYFNWYCLIFVVLLIFLLSGLFWLRKLSFKIYEQRKQLALKEAQNERLNQLPDELGTLEKEIALIEKFFPNKEELINFLNFLEKIAPQEDFNFSFQSQKAALDFLGQPFLRFTLMIKGDWQNELVPFFTSFFEGPYFIFPQNLSLESTDDIFKTSKVGIGGRIYVDQDFLTEETK